MRKALVLFLLVVSAGAALAQPPPSVGLKIGRPKPTVSRSESTSRGRHGAKSSQETKMTTSEFEGKVSCTLPKDQSFEVTVEAYFITRELGKKGVHDTIAEKKQVGKFLFGGDNPATCPFTFTTPPVVETTTKTTKTSGGRRRHSRRGGGSTSTETTHGGTRFMGVIVRALGPDGKVLKVVTDSPNPAWLKAGKAPVVSLD